jgi:sec-independent protein translocase protein TatA
VGLQVGPLELIVVLIIALIVLGPQRLPDVARSVGRGMREFRNALDRPDDDDEPVRVEEGEDAPAPPDEPAGAVEPAAAAESAPADYQKEADSSESSSSSRDLV